MAGYTFFYTSGVISKVLVNCLTDILVHSQALECHQKTNCLIEPVLEAEEYAADCDQREDKSRPLHGVPISIKEGIGMKVSCLGDKCLVIY